MAANRVQKQSSARRIGRDWIGSCAWTDPEDAGFWRKMVVECSNRVGSRENGSNWSEIHLLKPYLQKMGISD